MSKIVNVVVIAIHPSLCLGDCIGYFSPAIIQEDQRNFPHMTTSKHIAAALMSFREGGNKIIYIPFDPEVVAGCVKEGINVTIILPSPEYHSVLTGIDDKAYDICFNKFNELAAIHRIIVENNEQTPLQLLRNFFNSGHLGF